MLKVNDLLPREFCIELMDSKFPFKKVETFEVDSGTHLVREDYHSSVEEAEHMVDFYECMGDNTLFSFENSVYKRPTVREFFQWFIDTKKIFI